MANPQAQKSRTKRFFKRIEKFVVSCKQRVIVHHLLSHGGKDVVAKYVHDSLESSEPIMATSPIWICWWQGKDTMPDIAKACYNSVLMHADSYPVILITEKNYQEYVSLPSFIMEKQQSGEIDLTHSSDILRMLLLQQYAGVWMDSTVLIPAKGLNQFILPSSKFLELPSSSYLPQYIRGWMDELFPGMWERQYFAGFHRGYASVLLGNS